MLKKWLTFGLSVEQEDRYRKSCFSADLAQARVCLLLMLIPIIAFLANDYGFFGLSWPFYGLAALRFLLLVFTLVLLARTRAMTSYRTYDTAEFAWGLLVVLSVAVIHATRPENFLGHAVVAIVLVFVMLLGMPNKFINQIISSVAITLAEAGVIVLVSRPPSFQAAFSILSSMFLAVAVAMASSRHIHSYRRRAFLAAEKEQAAVDALGRLNVELEQRVAAHTEEIRRANETLEQRIAQRTTDLQAATDSLRDSRRAALNLMDDALAAGRQAEQAANELRQEVASRRRAEEALAREQANLRAVFDVVNIGMLLLDGDGVVKRVNNTISRWVGRTSYTCNGDQPGDFVGCVHAANDPAGCGHTPRCQSCRIRNAFESVLSTGQPVHDVEAESVLLIGGNEVPLWLEVSADPVLLDGKRHVILAMNNVTARKRAEEQVAALATFPQLNPNPIVEVDLEGRIHFMNPMAEVLLPNLRQQQTGHPWLADLPRIASDLLRGGGRPINRDIAVADRWYQQVLHYVEHTQRIRIYSVDITDRRRAERERAITIAFLQLVNENTDSAQLIHAATTFFQEQSGCEAVGVRVKEGEDYPYYEARGFPAEFVRLENSLCGHDASGAILRDSDGYPIIECMCGNVICGRFDPSKPFFTAHGSFWTNCTTELLATTSEADRQVRTRNRCNGEGYESVALLPLHVGGQRLGLLQLNDRRKGVFTPELIGLWERLADHFAVALSKFLAEEALRESEERHQLATSVANEAIWEVNLATGTTRWNRAYAELFGRPPEASAHGPWWLEEIHPEDRDRVDSTFREALAERTDSWFCAYRMKLADGSYGFLHDRAIIVRDQAGKPVRAVGAKLNMTKQKEAEQALQNSAARLNILAETAQELLRSEQPQMAVESLCHRVMTFLDCQVFFNFLVDENADRLHLNACAGIPPEEAARIEWLDYGVAVCGCAAREGHRIVAEHIPSTPDPRTDLVNSYGVKAYACHPIMGTGDKVLGTLSFGTSSRETFTEADLSLMKAITDQVAVAMIRLQSREDLRNTAENLGRSNKDLEQFAYVASHDLQEPLRMVSGFVQLLQKKYGGQLDSEADRLIEYAVDGSKQMQTLINDLLAYSRVGSRGCELVPTDAAATLRQVVEHLRPLLHEAGAELTHGHLPTVRADGTQLVQLFQNLIGNALKFRGSEPPKIHVDACRQGDHWLFSVRDNGIGIDPEYRDRIFLIFHRLHTRQKYAGTGIGLAICKKIVERHRGQIWVESQAGEGSVFYFTIPT